MNRKKQKKTWIRLFFLLQSYKKYIPIIFLCLLVTSAVTFLQPLLIQQITDKGMGEKNFNVITVFSGLFLLFGLINYVFRILQTNTFANMHNDFQYDLKMKVFSKFLHVPISYFERKNEAEVIGTFLTDIGIVTSITDTISGTYVTSIIQVCGGVTGLFLLNWKLATFILVALPVKYMLIHSLAKKKKSIFEEYLEHMRVSYAWLGDQIGGIRELKLWNLLKVCSAEYRILEEKVMKSYKKNAMLDEYNILFGNIVDMVLTSIHYLICGYLIVNGHFTIGSAFAFITYSAYVMNPMTFLVNIQYNYAKLMPSVERLFQFLDQPEENGGGKISEKTTNQKRAINSSIPKIEVKRVTFGYEQDKPIFNNLNFKLYTGEKVGIIGMNGSGKSTLLNLILGFYEIKEGSIHFEGKKIYDIGVDVLREKVAVVSQKIYLFQSSIQKNVDLKGEANLEAVKRACEKSGASSFIEKLPDRYKYCICMNGTNLSGGERQKIALARALLKEAEVWILDEASTGFDAESDQSWSGLLQNEFQDKTVLLVTHKYEELLGMDRVYRLEDGCLKELLQ